MSEYRRPATKQHAKSTSRVASSASQQASAFRKPRVFVGLSGGVDSALAAALLQDKGYAVTGVFMKNWTRDVAGWPCPWREDFRDAERVALKLGIELKIFDFQKQYKQKVVDYMIREYKAGRTPNPDIMCNQEIKFKLFLETALSEGADLIATGHYARIQKLPAAPPAGPAEPAALRRSQRTALSGTPVRSRSSKPYSSSRASSLPRIASEQESSGFQLAMALDKNKDQTYFLYRVSEQALAKTLFPIGDLASKAAVRAEARRRGMPVANKPDSQGICFVGEVGIADFIREFVKLQPGLIVDRDGKEIGQHDGAALYTIGQRKGLGIGGRRLPAGRQGGTPYYVTKVDTKKNVVYVTNHLDDENLWKSELKLSDTHWINGSPNSHLPTPIFQIRTRHRGELIPFKLALHSAHLKKVRPFSDGEVTIALEEPVRAAAPGQSAVIYDGTRVLGGGIIS